MRFNYANKLVGKRGALPPRCGITPLQGLEQSSPSLRHLIQIYACYELHSE